MKIKNKEDIINHFVNGNKEQLYIGVENEKFVFDKNTKKRSNYLQISKVLDFLNKEYGWSRVEEGKNLIGLKQNGKQVTLEPGNQIELAGTKLNNIHEVCSESYKFQDELKTACNKLDLELLSIFSFMVVLKY